MEPLPTDHNFDLFTQAQSDCYWRRQIEGMQNMPRPSWESNPLNFSREDAIVRYATNRALKAEQTLEDVKRDLSQQVEAQDKHIQRLLRMMRGMGAAILAMAGIIIGLLVWTVGR